MVEVSVSVCLRVLVDREAWEDISTVVSFMLSVECLSLEDVSTALFLSVFLAVEVASSRMVRRVVTAVSASSSDVVADAVVSLLVLFTLSAFAVVVEFTPSAVKSVGRRFVDAFVAATLPVPPVDKAGDVVLWADPTRDVEFDAAEGTADDDDDDELLDEEPEVGPKVFHTKLAAAIAASLLVKPPSV